MESLTCRAPDAALCAVAFFFVVVFVFDAADALLLPPDEGFFAAGVFDAAGVPDTAGVSVGVCDTAGACGCVSPIVTAFAPSADVAAPTAPVPADAPKVTLVLLVFAALPVVLVLPEPAVPPMVAPSVMPLESFD